MKRRLITFFVVIFLAMGCGERVENKVMEENITAGKSAWEGYRKVNIDSIATDIFKIHNEWALVTAGVDTSYNTMTINWGGFGTIWNKPVVFVFIRSNRYTFQFMEREEMFTVEFFDSKYRRALEVCGTMSGDGFDKVAEAGLTPVETPSGCMAFQQGDLIIECKKMYGQMLDERQLETMDKAKFYNANDGMHKMYVGEIVNVWKKVVR